MLSSWTDVSSSKNLSQELSQRHHLLSPAKCSWEVAIMHERPFIVLYQSKAAIAANLLANAISITNLPRVTLNLVDIVDILLTIAASVISIMQQWSDRRAKHRQRAMKKE